MNNYDLFKTDKSLLAFKTSEHTESTLEYEVGLKVRQLKQELISDLNIKQSFINIYASISDEIMTKLDTENPLNIYDVDSNDENFDLYDMCFNNLKQYFIEFGEYDDTDQSYNLSFTNSAGQCYSLCWLDNTDGKYIGDDIPLAKGLWCRTDIDAIRPIYVVRVSETTLLDVYMVSAVLSNSKDQLYSIMDLMSDLSDSIDIQDIFSESLEIHNNILDKYSITDKLAKYTTRANDDVMGVINNIRSAASSTGLYGVLNYVKDCYTNLSNVSADSQNGLIEYVDDSVWMPKSFLTGVIGGSISTITTAITAIISIINPVMGVIALAISSVANLIIKVLDFSKQTNVTYSPSVDCIPCFAISIMQSDRYGFDDVNSGTSVYDCLISNEIPLLVNSIGAWSILSYHDDGQNLPTGRINAFIDLVDRRKALRDKNLVVLSNWSEGGSGPELTKYEYDIPNVNILNFPVSETGLSVYVPEINADGTITADSDENLKQVVLVNLIYYIVMYSRPSVWPSSYHIAATTNNYTNFLWLNRKWYTAWDGYDLNDFETAMKAIGFGLYYLYHGQFQSSMSISWSEIASAVVMLREKGLISTSVTPHDQVYINKSNSGVHPRIFQYASSYHIFQDSFKPMVIPPQYDRTEMITSLALVGAVTVGTVVASVVVSYSAKKLITRKKAQHAAHVERAYNEFVKDPDNIEKYKDYRSAVRTNNLFNSVFGGTKYSKINYWAGDSSSNNTSLVSKVLQKYNTSNDVYEPDINTVIKLIKG